VQWAYKGHKGTTKAAPIVHEYFDRAALAKLGFTTDIRELDAVDAEIFLLIAGEINKLKEAELKRKRK
jgi:hypothetical protein